jgi:L-ascorbate metabolism protein UlaG (beta-lactamase superfamily)
MPTAPYKRDNKFFNHPDEKARHRVFNVAQFGWEVLVRIVQAKRQPFLAKGQDVSTWVERPNFAGTEGKTSITWLGHASCLIQFQGITILTDPVAGTLGRAFRRNLPVPIPFEKLPHVDVIVLSHNHRDHLDIPTLTLLQHFNPLVYVPLGDAKLFRRLGFHRVHECTWHESIMLETNKEAKKVELIFLPALHWSGRGVLDVNKSLWGSWLVRTPEASVYFAGDTAYGEHFANIANRYGPPDIALMPIGPEEPRNIMAASHVGVEEALQAFDDLASSHFFPIHWGTFALGTDRFQDPIEKLKELWPQPQRDSKKLHLVPAGRVVVLDDL